MARKPRDYAAEQRRRNELARQRGFTSRAAQRKAIESGAFPAIAPNRIRSEKTRAAQMRRKRPPRNRAPIDDTMFGVKLVDRKTRAEEWSMLFAQTDIARYRPEEAAKLGVTERAYTDAYLRAFVQGDTRYSRMRHYGGSADMRYWFVNLNGYMTVDEYESRYGDSK